MQNRLASELLVGDRFINPDDDRRTKNKVMNIEYDNNTNNKVLVVQNLDNGVIGRISFDKDTKVYVV